MAKRRLRMYALLRCSLAVDLFYSYPFILRFLPLEHFLLVFRNEFLISRREHARGRSGFIYFDICKRWSLPVRCDDWDIVIAVENFWWDPRRFWSRGWWRGHCSNIGWCSFGNGGSAIWVERINWISIIHWRINGRYRWWRRGRQVSDGSPEWRMKRKGCWVINEVSGKKTRRERTIDWMGSCFSYL